MIRGRDFIKQDHDFETRTRIFGSGLIFLGIGIRILGPGSDMFGSENNKFCLQWVHMARYELVLKLDGAIWLRIIFEDQQNPKISQGAGTGGG